MCFKIIAFLAIVGLVACHSGSPSAVIPPTSLPGVIVESGKVQLVRNPTAASSMRLVTEAEKTIKAVQSWIPQSSQSPKVRLVIYGPDEPEGSSFLRAIGTKQRAAGFFKTADHTVLLVGDSDDPRFWTVLRHEMAHYALRASAKKELPFWLDEGIATYYESGVSSSGVPLENPERLRLASYHSSSRGGLRLSGLLNSHSPKYQDGLAYAQAWAVTRYLYKQHKQETANWVRSGENLTPFPAGRFAGGSQQSGDVFENFVAEVSKSLTLHH